MSAVLAEAPQDPPGRAELADIELRLVAELSPPFPPEAVRRCIEQAAADFDGAPVRAFVPLLVERRVRRQLSGWRGVVGSD